MYRHDRLTGETVLVSAAADGNGGANGNCILAQISADGDIVVFNSFATNLHQFDQDSLVDIFARRISTGQTDLVSVNVNGNGGARTDLTQFDISEDGNSITFSANSNEMHALDHNDRADVFVRRLDLQTTILVSVNEDGTASGNGDSGQPEISDDGSIVGFVSSASDLTALDRNSRLDVYSRNLVANTTSLVSVNSEHTSAGNGGSGEISMSADGNRIAFLSYATDLNSLDTDSLGDIYVHSLDSGVTELVTVDITGTGSANSHCEQLLISADGNVVAFVSEATNLHPLDRFQQPDLYARNLATATTSLVSVKFDNSGSANSDILNGFTLSTNGRLVAFSMGAFGLHPLDMDAEIEYDSNDVFVRDLWTSETHLVSLNTSGTANGNTGSTTAQISANGTVVAFDSKAIDLVNGDKNGYVDVFARELSSDITSVLSRSSGVPPIGSANGVSTFEPFGDSLDTQPLLSADGRYAAFVSDASNLVGDPLVVTEPSITNVYRYDSITGDIVLVSVNGAGNGGGNRSSYQPVISADGNIVAFASAASDLIAGRSHYFTQVYARNILEGTTYCVSTREDQFETGGSVFPSISADGRIVAFESMSKSLSPLDTDANRDIYFCNRETGEIQLASVNTAGTGSGNGWAYSPRISADGSTIVYSSESSNLHPLDTETQGDLFARRLTTNTTELISINSAGTSSGNSFTGSYSTSADGNRIAFTSGSTDLNPLDAGTEADVFVRDLIAGTTILVSVNVDGTGGANGEYTADAVICADGSKVAFTSSSTNLHHQASAPGVKLFVRDLSEGITYLTAITEAFASPTLSADGNIIAFASGETGLHPLDTNGKGDVFVRNLATGAIQLVSLNTDGTSSANRTSGRPLISTSGNVVLFHSSASDIHVPDVNGHEDVFLAAVIWDQPEFAGDYNRDGTVNAADYTLWRNNLGATGLEPYSGADGNGDGTIGPEDYGVWKLHFGETIQPGAGSGEQGVETVSALTEPVAPVAAIDKEIGRQGDKESGGAAVARGFDTAAPTRVNAVAHIGSAGASPSRVRAAHGNADSPRDDALVAWLASVDRTRMRRDLGSDRDRTGGASGTQIDSDGGGSGARGTNGLHDRNCLAGDGLLNCVDAIFELVGGDI
jgi:hypothetical protein